MSRLPLTLLCLLLMAGPVPAQPGTGTAGGGGVRLRDEGALLGTVGTLDCVGAGVTCTKSGGTGTVTIPGGVTGSGTANFVPLWATSTTLGNSFIYQQTALQEIIIPGESTGAQIGTSPAAALFGYLVIENAFNLVRLSNPAFFDINRVNGTWAAPTKVLAGNLIAYIRGGAWDGVGFQYTPHLEFLANTDADSGSLSLHARLTRSQSLDVISLGGVFGVGPEVTITTENVKLAALVDLNTRAAPASPAAGKVSVFADSTDLRLHDKNASGVIGTTVVADTGAANNFLTAISVAGVISKAQPAFTNLSGSATCAQLPALTGDVTTSAGSCGTTVVNLPTGTTMAGSLLATAITAPGTPAAGKGSIYVDSTSKNLAVKDDAGVVKHGVQTLTCSGSQFVNAISDAGAVGCATPAGSGTVTGTGTTGVLTKWTNGAGGVLGDSLLSESGSVATLAGTLIPATTLATDLGDSTHVFRRAYAEEVQVARQTTGAEMVTNGTFATGTCDGWTFTGWTCTAGVDVQHNTGNVTALVPTTPLTVVNGSLYKLVFTISGRTAGTLLIGIGGGGTGFHATNATFTEYVWTVSTGNLTFTPSTDFDGRVDDVSVTQITGARVVVPRSSTGVTPILQWGSDTFNGINGSVGLGQGVGSVQFARNTWIGALAGPENRSLVGTDNVAIGYFTLSGAISDAVGTRNIAIGSEPLQDWAGNDAIGIGHRIGYTVQTNLERTIAIGHRRLAGSGTVGSQDAVLIGFLASNETPSGRDRAVALGTETSATADTIAIGYSAVANVAGDLVLGGNSASGGVTTAYVGQGKLKVSPAAVTWKTTGGSGTNNAGSDLTLGPGQSTGNATPPSLFIATGLTGQASGATLRALTNRWQFDGLNAGNFIPTTTNATDLGDSTHTVRTGYIGTSVIVGGNTLLGNIAGKVNAAHLAIASQAIGDLLYADSTTTFARLADVAVGSYTRSGGVGAAPLWSTLTLPNAATTGDTFIATGTNAMGVVAAGATGAYFRGAGAATAPIWSTLILPNTATTGDILAATSANTVGVIAAGTATHVLTANGAGVASTYQDSAASTLTFTNKTLNADSTGNVVTLPFKKWLPAAGCNNATAGTIWDLPTTTPAVAACVTGTNTQKAVLDYADTTGGFSAQITEHLPADWTTTGGVDVDIFWTTTATTGNAKWTVQFICTNVDATEADDPAFPTSGDGFNTVTTAAPGTSPRVQTSTITGATVPAGCATATKELLHIRLFRDGNDGADTITATARFIGMSLTHRRAM